jgi:hypothetical protein
VAKFSVSRHNSIYLPVPTTDSRRGTNVLKTGTDEKKEREALKEKRDQLFALLVRNPQDTGLAVEIKLIDDQIAECTKQMKKNGKG